MNCGCPACYTPIVKLRNLLQRYKYSMEAGSGSELIIKQIEFAQ